MHSPMGPIVRDSDDTINRAFFYFKSRNIDFKERPKTAIGNEKPKYIIPRQTWPSPSESIVPHVLVLY